MSAPSTGCETRPPKTLFSTWPGVEAFSAGTDSSATTPLTKELVASADVIFAMEKHHRDRIRKKYKTRPSDARIITLNIPDEYEQGNRIWDLI